MELGERIEHKSIIFLIYMFNKHVHVCTPPHTNQLCHNTELIVNVQTLHEMFFQWQHYAVALFRIAEKAFVLDK